LIERLIDQVGAARTIGVLLVRRGGWAAAVVADGTVLAADTGGGYVQGTTKAGGWSQQRYARRRGNQTQQVWDRAAVGAVEVFAAHRSVIGALVTGGDRTGVAAVLTDERLVDLAALVEPRFFAIGDPARTVLEDVVRRLRCVVITLNELA
jgi:peptide subunit release factor 1 (eRF1)